MAVDPEFSHTLGSDRLDTQFRRGKRKRDANNELPPGPVATAPGSDVELGPTSHVTLLLAEFIDLLPSLAYKTSVRLIFRRTSDTNEINFSSRDSYRNVVPV